MKEKLKVFSRMSQRKEKLNNSNLRNQGLCQVDLLVHVDNLRRKMERKKQREFLKEQ
jgi:hypothetical protein